MATSVTQSLFGMTPQAIQAQRAAELNQQAMQFAQLTPMQQAQMGMFRAGSQLGTGVAGAMGYEDPEIAQAREVQGMLSGANMNDPDSLMEIAQRIQSVNPAAAQELAQRAMTMRKTQAEIRAKESEPVNKLIQAGKYTPESVAAYAQTGRISDLQLTESEAKFSTDAEEVARELHGKAFKDLTPEEAEAVNVLRNQRRVKEREAGRSSVSVDARSFNAAETAYGQVVGKDSAERDVKLIDAAEAAGPNLTKMYETRQLIETGDLRTGIAAEALLVLDRARAKFLSDPRAAERVADTEYLDALLGSDVFPQISALGIGARGLDTPAEREFLRQVITGTISLDRETLKRMTDFRIKSAERAVERYNERLQKGDFSKYQEVTGRELNPISKPPRAGTAIPSGTSGQTSSGTTYRIIRN
jgi:hypothetical protein